MAVTMVVTTVATVAATMEDTVVMMEEETSEEETLEVAMVEGTVAEGTRDGMSWSLWDRQIWRYLNDDTIVRLIGWSLGLRRLSSNLSLVYDPNSIEILSSLCS
jgi:hypothetical protein